MSDKKVDPFALDAGVPIIEGDLRPAPKFADRISSRVPAVGFGILALILVLFFIALNGFDDAKILKKPTAPAKQLAQATNEGNRAAPPEVTGEPVSSREKNVPPTVPVPATLANASAPGDLSAATKIGAAAGRGGMGLASGSVPPIGSDQTGLVPLQPVPNVQVPALTPEQQAAQTEKTARLTRAAQARNGGLQGKLFDTVSSDRTAPASPTGAAGLTAGLADLAAAVKGATQAGAPRVDGEQDEKLDFVKQAGKDDRGYHPYVQQSALSKNEVKTGAYIPMTLEQSINSDLPGQVTARISEDVYDTISGCSLLVPAMSKVVGKYDSKIAIGQNRMLVVWNSLVFPNGDELNMAGMQAYDESGETGLGSDVDNHYWRLFGMTFGLSMVTAGVQLSVPQPNTGANGAVAQQTPAQIVATALAQQYGTLGAQIIGKYMAVQPTLRNYAGERFVVMVPRTIVFKKVWRSRC